MFSTNHLARARKFGSAFHSDASIWTAAKTGRSPTMERARIDDRWPSGLLHPVIEETILFVPKFVHRDAIYAKCSKNFNAMSS